MKKFFTRSSLMMLCAGMVLSAVFAAGFVFGTGFHLEKQQVSQQPASQLQLTPDMILHADSAMRSDKVALATGQVADGTEGLYALDFASGDLFCWVLNPKAGAGFKAQYVTNVLEPLGLKKGEENDFLLTTGAIDNSGVPTGNNATRPANSVCYVADGNTGRVAGFTFYYSRNVSAQRAMQFGELVKVCEGTTRGNIERD
jgi:hypothetical protein